MAKPKNLIKRYKSNLKDKLDTVINENAQVTNLLNEYVNELKHRVDEFLQIKDDKCLSMYRELNKDLEHYREKLIVVQACFEGSSDEDSDCQDEQNDDSEARSLTKAEDLGSVSSIGQSTSLASCSVQIISEDNGNGKIQLACDSITGNSIPQASPSPSSHVQDFGGSDLLSLEECMSNNSLAGAGSYSLPSSSLAQKSDADFNSLCSKTSESINQSALERYESCHSLSQGSCYQSISSNISGTSETKNRLSLSKNQSLTSIEKAGSQSQSLKAKPPPLEIEIPSKLSGTISFIVNPGDFWMQLERSESSPISYSMKEYSFLSRPSSIKPDEYCLAPFKLSTFYYRALSLEESPCGSRNLVNVLFIDHGSIQEVPLEELCHMPFSAYSYPMQAIHCHLYGIVPKDEYWTNACIERFKEFNTFLIDIVFKSKKDSYGVQLIAKTEGFDDLSTDIALTLSLEGLAVSDRLNQGSHDSGVSVSSNYKTNQVSRSPQSSNIVINQDRNLKILSDTLAVVNLSEHSGNDLNDAASMSMNLMSFESCNSLNSQTLKEGPIPSRDMNRSLCQKCRSLYCLHLNVPPPTLVFVKKDWLIVLPSHIVSPFEFYVNLAMDDILNFDELREQMTAIYESQKHRLPVCVEDLYENMFCAGFYHVDKHWYRVKILKIHPEEKILVQYIDYGNCALLECSDLLPLTPEFAQHPYFAIRCSLAGVSPRGNPAPSGWNENAVATFKELACDDKCLTAQICWDLCNSRGVYPVLLWIEDAHGSDDLLINQQLAVFGVATFDVNLLHEAFETDLESDALDTWNPMNEEFNDVLNSYGVDNEDFSVRTCGYRGEDDKNVCKYFANRGYCPRETCSYLHVPLLEDGVTRDQKEVFCLENPIDVSKSTTNFLVQVSAVISPSFFYVVLPFGCKSLDEIEQMVKEGKTVGEIVNSEAKALFHAIHHHYSKAPFQENTAIDLAFGSIVVAFRHWDQKFHRGRVIDASDVDGFYKIFFVDFGDTEYVHRKNIRTILPQFFYTTFQSLLCCLAGVKPIGSNENRWPSDAVMFFKKLVEGQTLLAEIVYRDDMALHISLRRTNQDNHQKLSYLLASEGFAELCPEALQVERTPRFVPG